MVAISQDHGPHVGVAFLKSHGLRDLGAYQDSDMGLSGALGPEAVLPTSILIDANGREVWRYVGELDWTSAEAARLLSEAGAPEKVEGAAVDGGEAQCDQPEPEEILRRECLVQEQPAQNDRDRRHQ